MKEPKKKTLRAPRKQIVKNETMNNGLSDLMGSPFGYNPGTGSPFDTTQLSQANTLFKNNRWYLVSNFRQLLNEIYVEHGLVQTVVDVPVDDGLRGGVLIKSKQLSEDQIEKIRTEMERQKDLITVGQALKWNRLFGGAGILILTDQNAQTELKVDRIGPNTPLEFRAVDMWELFWDLQNTEGYDQGLERMEFEYYSYYAKKVHKSRVMQMKGLTAPSFIRPRLRGWGFSIVEALVRSINQYLKSNDLAFEILDEFKIDYYKIKNLTNTLLSDLGTQKVRQRIQVANYMKNYQNAVVMDSEDDFQQKQLTFAGLAEMNKEFRMQVASDLRMPLTKLFGISATGFNSGEDDIENYNSMVESQVREKCKFDILKIIELRSQKLFGFMPDDVTIEFKPLRVLSSEQEENVKTQKFARVLQATTAGLMSHEQFAEACNKANLLEVQIDVPPMIDIPLDGDEASGNPTGTEGDEVDSMKIAPAPKSQLQAKEAKQ